VREKEKLFIVVTFFIDFYNLISLPFRYNFSTIIVIMRKNFYFIIFMTHKFNCYTFQLSSSSLPFRSEECNSIHKSLSFLFDNFSLSIHYFLCPSFKFSSCVVAFGKTMKDENGKEENKKTSFH
jgi:hypothetical protein